MASTVPSATIGPTGIVVPTQAQLLWGSTGLASANANAGVMGDLNNAFGGNLNTATLSTPQGQLASSVAAYIADKNSMFSYFVSQVDPQYSQGFMQDGIGRIFGMTRLPATYTTITGTCTGATGTVIPVGAQVQDTAGNIYATATGGTIAGATSVVFTAVLPGPVACAAGTLTKIMTTTPGWDAVTNPFGTDTNPLLLGVALESASAFEARRQSSLYANGQSMSQSILAAVLASGSAIPNYPLDCYVYDNSTNAPTAVGGITIPANSLYVAVQGGDPASIGKAIWSKKSVGASYAPSAAINATTTFPTTPTVLTINSVTYGNVQVGQTVAGVGIPANTTILSFGTFNGTSGTVNLSVGATAAGTVAMTTATQIVVQDTAFFSPAPTYNVLYTTPQQVPLYIAVSLVNNPNLPATVTTLVQNAVSSAMLGTDGGTKTRIGATIYGTRFYSAILASVPQAQIISIFVGLAASPTGSSVTPQINQYFNPSQAVTTLTLV